MTTLLSPRPRPIILFGHPRSRTNLVASYLEKLPVEIFDLSRLDENLKLNFLNKYSVSDNIQSGRAQKYLELLALNPPTAFKVFGFHLDNWPQAYNFIATLTDAIFIRIFRKNKFEAIISLLVGTRQGWSSFTEKSLAPFEVSFNEFAKAFDIIVRTDKHWSDRFQFDLTLEYNDIPTLMAEGYLVQYGFSKKQIHPFRYQNSIEKGHNYISNFSTLPKWFDQLNQKHQSEFNLDEY